MKTWLIYILVEVNTYTEINISMSMLHTTQGTPNRFSDEGEEIEC